MGLFKITNPIHLHSGSSAWQIHTLEISKCGSSIEKGFIFETLARPSSTQTKDPSQVGQAWAPTAGVPDAHHQVSLWGEQQRLPPHHSPYISVSSHQFMDNPLRQLIWSWVRLGWRLLHSRVEAEEEQDADLHRTWGGEGSLQGFSISVACPCCFFCQQWAYY